MEAGIINRLIVDRGKRIYKARVPYDPCYNCIANLSSQLPLQVYISYPITLVSIYSTLNPQTKLFGCSRFIW